MVNVQKICIKGFKNIDDTTIDFGKITALVALNNYGKSNLIEAIAFANLFIKSKESERNKLMSIDQFVPINQQLADSNFEFSITLSLSFQEEKYFAQYTFAFEWFKGKIGKGQKIINEELKLKKAKKGSRYSTLIHRNKTEAFYLSSLNARCDTPVKIGASNLVLSKLSNYDKLFYTAILEQLLTIQLVIYPLDPSLHLLSRNTIPFYRPERQDFLFNIAQSAYFLKENHADKYALWIDAIQSLIPEIEVIELVSIDINAYPNLSNASKIPFNASPRLYDIYVKTKNNIHATGFSYLSSGTKKIIALITSIIIGELNQASLFICETMENNIHPYLMQKLLIILDSLTGTTKILFSSHSTDLIQYLDFNSIYIGIPNKQEIAYFRKIRKSKRKSLLKYAETAHYSLGQVIFDMLGEAAFEESIFQEYV